MRAAWFVLGLGLALAIAAPRAVQAATNPVAVNTDAQREQVAIAFVDEFFATAGYKPLQDAFAGALGAWYFANLRPEWRTALNEAASEELDADRPTVDAIMARQLAKDMTLDELQAGLVIIRDPAMAAALKANLGHAPSSNALPPLQLDAQRAAVSPAGQSFGRKFDRFDELMSPVKPDLTFAVMPGVLRRFGEKAEAVEAQKRASPK
jgi:hypothetical protein